ncbi:MAG: hypothetical protein ACI87E_004925, partial [Mariniblastus sp.]
NHPDVPEFKRMLAIRQSATIMKSRKRPSIPFESLL